MCEHPFPKIRISTLSAKKFKRAIAPTHGGQRRVDRPTSKFSSPIQPISDSTLFSKPLVRCVKRLLGEWNLQMLAYDNLTLEAASMATTSPRRKPATPETEKHILTKSRRRCALCFHLDRDTRQKRG